jgi:hypothetical protein
MRNKTVAALIALLAALAGNATAQTTAVTTPSCWVPTGAVGYTTGETTDGRYAAWWCPEPWDYSAAILVMRTNYVLKHPTLPAGASLTDTMAAYWKANVLLECFKPSSDPGFAALCAAAGTAALNSAPFSRWIVAPYPGATYRSTYATSAAIDGVRTKTASGKVLILDGGYPVPCNCKLGRVAETTSTGTKVQYCSVGGAATTVAACRLR